jgi:predicted RNase H-related nuclease YkuK (DUF458 family)
MKVSKLFQKVSGEKIESISQYVKNYIEKDNLTSEFEIIVGCDSLPRRFGYATYVTVVCIYRIGRGAHIVYSRESRVKTYNFKDRLWGEVYRAADVASDLFDAGVIDFPRVRKFDVHLDLNKKKQWKSNVIHDEALGYIRGLGFDVYSKPDSPVATFAADHVCRNKEKKMCGNFPSVEIINV